MPEAMTLLRQIAENIIAPGLALLPPKMDSREARVMLLAIGQQESGFLHRVQRPLRVGGSPGPARGFWQFERGGGVKGVMEHRASAALARDLCEARGVEFKRMPVWSALATDDLLACGFARLLLFTDPRPLPAVGDPEAGWGYYVRNWLPGKPHHDRWGSNYRRAAEVG